MGFQCETRTFRSVLPRKMSLNEPHARTREAVASFFEGITCCSSEHDDRIPRKDSSLLRSGSGVGVGINFQQRQVATQLFLAVSTSLSQKTPRHVLPKDRVVTMRGTQRRVGSVGWILTERSDPGAQFRAGVACREKRRYLARRLSGTGDSYNDGSCTHT